MGSPSGSRKDIRDTLEFAAAHGIRPQLTRFPLAEAQEALDEMKAGKLIGRAVLTVG
jgi:D-arabinose 1-dehydrogenase-like Zn-dependent alcohol dehydrogenase